MGREREKERERERETAYVMEIRMSMCDYDNAIAYLFVARASTSSALPIQQQDDCFSGALFLFDMSTVSGR